MCGIAGLVSVGRQAESELFRVEAAVYSQRHRGPDDSGLEIVNNSAPAVILGHRRLAIIDLSRAGRQPMRDEETGNWITFNGEIYNFRQLRHDLRSAGVNFRTETDTEVILRAFATWGDASINRLRGIFAFGLWDAARQRLLLVRDQLGVKPLYYWSDGGDLMFASEVRALLTTELVPRHLDVSGLRSYLAFGSVQEPLTLIRGVRSLLPGHFLTWKNGKTESHKYWQLPEARAVGTQSIGTSSVSSSVAEVLQESVKLQMVSDVPLGAFLSGGIDSTAVAALMQQAAARQVRTFAVVFDETEYDEREYSRLAAARIGTRHTELPLTGKTVLHELPRALEAFDQPSVDGLNTYFVSKVTKEAGLTVALSGVGGDELFGGYDGFSKALMLMRWGRRAQRLPLGLRRMMQTLLSVSAENEARRKAVDVLDHKIHPYFVSRQLFSGVQARRLLKPDLYCTSTAWPNPRFDDLVEATREFDDINRVSAFELQTYMLSTLLRDTDQMSMAHALEVRVPLLDHKLVELMFTVPGQAKLDSGVPKPLLTNAVRALIPDECIFRPKRGFTLPFERWLRTSLLEPIERAFVEGSSDVFVSRSLEQLFRSFRQRRLSWSRIWGVFVLNDWLARHRITFSG